MIHDQTIEAWSIALFGWFGYNLLVYHIEKNYADDSNAVFDHIKFFKTHWDNWLVTLVFSIPIVYYGPEIHDLIIKGFAMNYEWHDFYYAGPGVFVELLIWGLKTLKKKINNQT